jgi:hypothetical protein
MAKSEFICKSCKSVKTSGILDLGYKRKYKCPKHGFICGKCVSTGILKTKCKKCNSKVVKYSWDSDKDKWINS